MEIKTLFNKEVNSIIDLLPPGWESAIRSIEFYTNSNFCFPIKVSIDKKIVGIGTAIIHNKTAWLAHIIVHPDYRNQSIGKTITQTLVEMSYSKGCETIYLLATELGEPVYKKIGFEIETEYLFFKGEIINEADVNSENIVVFNPKFKEQFSILDQQVSGENRMFHLEQYLSNSFLYLENKQVKGFYLPNFGDGLIIATTILAGQELMKLRITSKDYAVFPVDNIIATEFVTQNNFKEIRIQKRMRLGKERNWQPTNIYNRIGHGVRI
jgi:N-acetylglutamate synthase-like GNAT family acetyltransferase